MKHKAKSPRLLARLFDCSDNADVTPHEQRRLHVLTAAKICVAKFGFHGASMQQICAEAQMSPGALYRYFSSKDEIIAAIADDERQHNAVLLSDLGSDGDPVERLISVILRFLQSMERPGTAALMTEVFAESLRNSEIAKRFLVNEAEADQAVTNFLQASLVSGAVEPIIPLKAVIGALSAFVEGLVIRRAMDPSLTTEALEPILRAMLVALLRPKNNLHALILNQNDPEAADTSRMAAE